MSSIQLNVNVLASRTNNTMMSTITITVIKHTNTMIKLMNTMIKLTPEDIGENEPLERFPLQLDGVGSGHHAAQSKEHLQAGHFAVRDTLGRKSLKEKLWGVEIT